MLHLVPYKDTEIPILGSHVGGIHQEYILAKNCASIAPLSGLSQGLINKVNLPRKSKHKSAHRAQQQF